MKSIDTHIRYAKRLVTILDTKFSLFGIRFGIDPLFDIIPGFGSLVGSATSCYLLWLAYKLQVPAGVYVRMLVNIMADFLVGSIPLAGIAFDLLFRSNLKNLKLLEPYYDPNVVEGEILKEN